VSRAEGVRLVGYLDTKGVPTNGYGHTGPNVYVGQVITKALALYWLEGDLIDATNQAMSLPEWSALDTPCRRNAVVECVFNLGVGHWTSEFPRTRASIKAQAWPEAQANLLDSPLWIKDVGLGRVQRLANYIGSGFYPAAI
jgi:GH24 family phage-related lysozyme (muramidase)